MTKPATADGALGPDHGYGPDIDHVLLSEKEIQGRDVLIVEDIIDSGLTLNYLLKNLRSRRPATLEVCALLRKPDAVKVEVPVKYIGFDIPNEFVIGYGLDYAERYRDLPYIATLKPEVYQ